MILQFLDDIYILCLVNDSVYNLYCASSANLLRCLCTDLMSCTTVVTRRCTGSESSSLTRIHRSANYCSRLELVCVASTANTSLNGLA